MSRTCWLACAALFAALACHVGPKNSPSAEPSKPAAALAHQEPTISPEAAVEKALSQRITVKFVQSPLAEVFRVLGEECKINITLDRSELRRTGIAADRPLDFSVSDGSLRSVLATLGNLLGLDWTICGEVLLITTPRRAESLLWTRIYPVDDLIGSHDKSGRATGDAKTLVKIITQCVAPQTWREADGRGSLAVAPSGNGKTLVVRQNRRVHEQVAELLARFRNLAGRPAARGERDKAGEEAIHDALLRNVTINFDETALKDVVHSLKEQCPIPIELDRRALAETGLGDDSPVTCKRRRASLRSALRQMLIVLDLVYCVRDDVLWITTREAVKKHGLMARVYPVGDVIVRHDDSGKTSYDFDLLTETIRKCIHPTSWTEGGESGAVCSVSFANVKALVIWQTPDVHEEVAELMMLFRRVARDTAAGKTAPRYGGHREYALAERAIHNALRQKITWDFKETPLAEVARSVSKSSGIDVKLDTRALADVGLGPDVPMTLSVREISLRSALELMLGQQDLTYLIHEEMLYITTQEEPSTEWHPTLGLYPVGDLARRRDRLGQVTYDCDWLVKLIAAHVRPEKWERPWNCGAICPVVFDNVQVLVVSHVDFVHEEIARLLAASRKADRQAADDTNAQTVVSCNRTPGDLAAEKRIGEALTRKVTLKLEEMPLSQVVAHLAKIARTNIFLDHRGLADIGLGSDVPVSLRVDGVSVRSALELILDKFDLTWMIYKEVVLITTREEEGAEDHMTTRIYPVPDLVVCRDESGELWDDYRRLIHVVQTIRPESWDELGGSGTVSGASFGKAKILVVTHSTSVHRRITKLLAELRDVARTHAGEGRPPLRARPPAKRHK